MKLGLEEGRWSISIEAQIIKVTIRALLEAGFLISVYDGEETTVHESTNAATIFAAMKTTDEDYLYVWSPEGGGLLKGWVRFVYGNEDIEVINGYTISLNLVMNPIMDMIDEYFFDENSY